MVPLLMQGVQESEAVARALVLLQRLGLEPRQKHRPSMLSGGEQQRVSLARALVGKPVLVLADEPTGHLDQGTTRQVFEVMVEQIRRSGAAFIMVTHNLDLAASCQRTLTLDHGRLAIHG
jgi:predicted ABC-type transport system involved in lysophospholipase L1 biosynthesis ATPase subunit